MVSPLLKVFISLTTKSILSLVLNSRIDRPQTTTLYQGSPFLRLVNKGNTSLIIASFCNKNSALNSGVVFTTILLLTERDTIEMTSPYIPLALNALLSKSRIRIDEKESAYTLCTSRRVHLLERASLPVFALSLGPKLVLFLLVPALLPWLPCFLPTIVQFWIVFWPGQLFRVCNSTILAQKDEF